MSTSINRLCLTPVYHPAGLRPGGFYFINLWRNKVMDLQEQDQTQAETTHEEAKEQQSQGPEIKAEIHHIKLPSSMLQLALDKMNEENLKAEKEAKEKALAENPYYVELIEGAFDNLLPIFFKDEAHMRNFASNWPMIPADGIIIANDVKLRRDLATDKTCNLRIDRKIYSGIIYYGSIF